MSIRLQHRFMIKRLPIFSNIDKDTMKKVYEFSSIHTIKQGEVFHFSQTIDDFLFIIEGTVEIIEKRIKNDVLIRLLSENCVISLPNQMKSNSNMVYCYVKKPSIILSIPWCILLHFLVENQAFRENMLRLLQNDLFNSYDLLSSIVSQHFNKD